MLSDLFANQNFIDSAMIMCNFFTFEAQWANPFNKSKIFHFKDENRSRYEHNKYYLKNKWNLKAQNILSDFVTFSKVILLLYKLPIGPL